MLQKFGIKDFKCHEDYYEINIPGLTIVSGTNNAGKSSILESLYLTTQHKGKTFPILALNDELNLGSFTDILNKSKSQNDALEFTLDFSPSILSKSKIGNITVMTVTLSYHNPLIFKNIPVDYSNKNPILSHLEIEYQRANQEPKTISLDIVEDKPTVFFKVSGADDKGYCRMNGIVPEPVLFKALDESGRKICSEDFEIIRHYLSLLSTENIRYLKALRPGSFIDKKYPESNSYLGLSGEYTAEILYKNWNKPCHFNTKSPKPDLLSELFDLWIRKLLGNEYRIRPVTTDKEDLKFGIIIEDISIDLQLPLNQVGTGISQLLPMLTLIFSSKEDDIILIENPEVHFHPKLQAIFIDLCLFAIENNRKIIVETHSEHLINRLRFRIKENNTYLEKVNILFLEKIEGVVRYTSVNITKDGAIDFWPENFFDQSYKDLLGLIQ